MATLRKSSLAVMSLVWGVTVAFSQSSSTVLPTRFDADRVYLLAKTTSGKTIELYTDTGGGLLVSISAAQRLGLLLTSDATLTSQVGPDAKKCSPPVFAPRLGIPAIPASEDVIALPHARQMPEWPDQGDGILGQAWFAGHVWTWDYMSHRLVLRPPNWEPKEAHRVDLGFRKAPDGKRELNFPRVEVQVDDKTISMLLDTGAETLLTSEALSQIHDGLGAFRATSMIAHTIFGEWTQRHPDWLVINGAQVGTHSRMIRVPDVVVAAIPLGPVWFTERPDENYHGFMSQMTDAQVEGSIGGNALSRSVLTIDYPRAIAWLQHVDRSDATH